MSGQLAYKAGPAEIEFCKYLTNTFDSRVIETLTVKFLAVRDEILQCKAAAPVPERTKSSIVVGDMFWDVDDPEYPQDSPQEIMDRHGEPETVIEIMQASRDADIYGFYLNFADDPEEDSDNKYFYFATKGEAEAELARLLKREKRGTYEG